MVKNLTPVKIRAAEFYMSFDPVRGLFNGGYIPFIHARKRENGDRAIRSTSIVRTA